MAEWVSHSTLNRKVSGSKPAVGGKGESRKKVSQGVGKEKVSRGIWEAGGKGESGS